MCAPILTDDKRNDRPGDSGGVQNAPTTQKTPFVAMLDMCCPTTSEMSQIQTRTSLPAMGKIAIIFRQFRVEIFALARLATPSL
jgi:hypothetical protein